MTSTLERIAVVESRVAQLEQKVDEINSKLDELLALRYKGAGAFWLASALVGTGIVGALFQLLNWIKG
jgi:hypothetical protein